MKDIDTLSKRLPYFLGLILGFALFALVVVIALYYVSFPGPISEEPGVWGQFGDYVGGTLNPIFSLLGLIALLLTIILQSRELATSTQELARSAQALKDQHDALLLQNFERTFFEMVRLHNDIVRSLDVQDSRQGIATTGRDGFRLIYQSFRNIHGHVNSSGNVGGQAAIVTAAYSELFRDYEHQVGHYFRNLHRIMKFVDESAIDDKLEYTGLVRAQLSAYEQALLFYNILHPVGEKLKPLIERYSMLENMNPQHLCNPPDELPLVKRSAYGDQDLSKYLPEA